MTIFNYMEPACWPMKQMVIIRTGPEGTFCEPFLVSDLFVYEKIQITGIQNEYQHEIPIFSFYQILPTAS